MRYQVIIPKSVRKVMDRLPNEVVRKILTRLAGLETDPRPADVKQLKGRNAWRIRIGDYNYAAPAALRESKRDSNPSAQDCEERATLRHIPQECFQR